MVKGRKGRFPARFLSFPLMQAGDWAGRGAGWAQGEAFWGRYQWFWRADERVWVNDVCGVWRQALSGSRPGWRVGFGVLVKWYGWMVRRGKGEVSLAQLPSGDSETLYSGVRN